jgi:hypothetical protein
MQTILKVICDNRGQANMVDDYLVKFAARAAQEPESIEFPSPYADDVAFTRADGHESRDNCAEKPGAQLESFGQSPNQANGKTKFIFMNPIILSCRPDGQNLRLWVESPSPGTDRNTESE